MRDGKQWRDLAFGWALGLEIVFCVCIGALIGYYIDRYFQTQPWFFLLFIAFGMAAAGKAIWREVKRQEREQEKK